MAGYSVKRNEILHFDDYNPKNINDDTDSLLKTLFLDLVGDGTDILPGCGFEDVSPFITKIRIEHETLKEVIIENLIKPYYKWDAAGTCENNDDGFINYATPAYCIKRGIDYNILSKEECDVSFEDYTFKNLSPPSGLFNRFAKYVEVEDGVTLCNSGNSGDIGCMWIDVSTTDPDGYYIMPIISFDGHDNLIANEVEYKKEIFKIIRLISSKYRGNTISTNVENPNHGYINNYKYTNDIITGEEYHEFWIVTERNDPLFKKESDKCINNSDGEDNGLSKNDCLADETAYTWKLGTVIPKPQILEIDFPDAIMGGEYEVLVAPEGEDKTGKPYSQSIFNFFNNLSIDPDDIHGSMSLKKNLINTWNGHNISNDFEISLNDSNNVEIKDKLNGRKSTTVITSLGNHGSTIPSISTPGATNKPYDTGFLNGRKSSISIPPSTSTNFTLGIELSFSITMTANTAISPAFVNDINYSWSYLVTDMSLSTNNILNLLASDINNSDKFILEDGGRIYNVTVSGNQLNHNFVHKNMAIMSDGSINFGVDSNGSGNRWNRIVGTLIPGTSFGQFDFTVSKLDSISPDANWNQIETINQQPEIGTNTKISFNFHMWKDMYWEANHQHKLVFIDKRYDATWKDQPIMSFDSDFTDINEIKDHSMGPLVLQTKESDENYQLSGKVLTQVDEKPQKWRIRFDVNRGTELIEQSNLVDVINNSIHNDTKKYMKGDYVIFEDRYYRATNDNTTGTFSYDPTSSSNPWEPVSNFVNINVEKQKFEYLEVNVGTEYQILSNGKVGKLESNDGIKDALIKNAGYLGYIREQFIGFDPVNYDEMSGNSLAAFDDYDYIYDRVRLQKGLFRRSTKVDIEGSYPMSYRLTVAPHGLFFHIADDASVDQSDDFAWFVVQRHVEPGTGSPYTDVTAPLHCVYMSSEPPEFYSDLYPYFLNKSDTKKIENVYSHTGEEIPARFKDLYIPEIGIPDISIEGRFRRFVVREKNVLKPWDIHKLASVNTVDSAAIMHVGEQLSISDRNKTILNFPNRLCSQTFMFTNSELDIIAYCDAGVIAETTYIKTSRYGNERIYEALKSTQPNGNGMRIIALVGGDIITNSDIDPNEVFETSA